ncbi:MAG: HEAT repeat domain-containing protein [Nitrospira sp.]|nr:HEAT repeat domain-containing protein [Nitrospira sp.]
MSDAVTEQIAALMDEDWGIREDAATALGQLQDARGVSPLIRALGDSDRAVRQAAAASLKTLGEPAIVPLGFCLQDSNLEVQESASSILAAIADDRVLEPLLSSLLSPNWIVRMHSVKALGRIQASRTLETLLLLLQDKVPAVRDEAAKAIANMGEASLPPLLEQLENADWHVRLRAVETLALLKSPGTVEPLMTVVLKDPDTAVRQDAVRTLGIMGNARAIPLLLEALKDPSLKLSAIQALGQMRSRDAVQALISVIEVLPIADFVDRMEGCTDPRYKEELPPLEAAVKALAQIGDPQAIPVLVNALKSTLLRQEAAEALTHFGVPAKTALFALLKTEPDQNLRHHIMETLSQLGWRPGQVRL